MHNHDISRILHAAQMTPWAITKEKLAEIRHLLWSRAHGVEISAEEKQRLMQAAEDRQRFTRVGAIAVMPVFGTIAQRMNLMMAYSGGTSTELLEKSIKAAIADPDISTIVLDVDSPGGTVSGLPELHAIMMDARGKKPIVASVNSFSASAAFWITSAASEIAVTPSGEAGSIGVFALHVDQSVALEQEGIKVTFIEAPEGGHKTEGNRYEPLSEEAQAAIQKDVNDYYAMFVRDVAKGRGVSVSDVREKFGQGRMLLAKDALAAGMVDRIESMTDTLARLSRGTNTRARRAASDLDLLNV